MFILSLVRYLLVPYNVYKIGLSELHKNTCIMYVLDHFTFIIPDARARMSFFCTSTLNVYTCIIK